jgi:hypothetical protein
MKYSKENYVETAGLSFANVVDELGAWSDIYDKRTSKAYVATQDGVSDVELEIAIKQAGSQLPRPVDFVSLVGLTGKTGGPVARYPLNGNVLDTSGNGFDGAKSGYGPVARYSLNGNVLDSSGNGNNGTPNNITYEDGIVGQAARFNGADSYISLPSGAYSAIDLDNPFSVSVWVKPDTITPADAFGRIISIGGGGTVAETFRLNVNSVNLEYVATVDDGTTAIVVSTVGDSFTTDFAHLVVVWDGTSLQIFLNGDPISSATGSVSGVTPNDGYIGGATGGPATNSFDGLADQINIYDYALSPAEVLALFKRPAGEAEDVDGVEGLALSFNGIDQYVSLPSGAYSIFDPANQAFSVSVWVKLDTLTPDASASRIIESRDGGQYSFRAYYTKASARFDVDITDGSTSITNLGTSGFATTEWAHLAFVWDGSGISIYENGVLNGTSTGGALTQTLTPDSGRIGATPSGFEFLEGSVDQFRIYNYALSAIEVATIASATNPAADANTGRYSISLRNNGAEVASQIVALTTPVEQNYAIAEFDSVEADEVLISFSVQDGQQFGIGYAYVGELSEALKIRDFNYSIESADPRNITRSGSALTSQTYQYAALDITIAEKTFTDLRRQVRELASDGYASPRLWYFDGTCESCIMTGEAVYAILDSSRVQIDPSLHPKNDTKAQATIGLTEVF